jgi:hypothetical protein
MIQSRAFGRLLVALGAAIAALALLVPAASAKEPAPGYGAFAGCPSPEEDATVLNCVRQVVTGGNFKMGSKNVPIENPITITGGLDDEFNFHANAKGGLTPVKQVVPGGVIGLTGLTWLLEFFGINALSLYATTELAGKPGSLAVEPIALPIRVHLETPSGVLGKNCYVGTFTNPIKLNLIVGTTNPPPPNEPITGKPVEEAVIDELGVVHFNNGILVDNSFAAPGASGCVLTLFGFIPISINGLVNSQSGLPSAAGNNETKQNTNLELVDRNLVYP